MLLKSSKVSIARTILSTWKLFRLLLTRRVLSRNKDEESSSVQMEAVVEQTIIDVPGVEPELPAVEVVPPQKSCHTKDA